MKILLVTGIYPPEIGGPAQYAKNVVETWRKEGHTVSVLYFKFEKRLPTGLRHLLFFIRTLSVLSQVDFILALDTFSVGLPATLAGKIFGKKVIIRTGGDFLWEGYVERTKDPVLLRDFYATRPKLFNQKERAIFSLTKWTLRNASAIVWSTEWQRDIFMKPYGLEKVPSFIIENFYGPKITSYPPKEKNFVAGTRALSWKNIGTLGVAFSDAKKKKMDLILDLECAPYEAFFDKIQHAYAVILVSLGDISPNMILDALRADKPFILTKETGLHDKLRDVALFVDPEDPKDITEKILLLSDPLVYETYVRKIKGFAYFHSWEEITKEFLNVFEKINKKQ